VGGAKKGLSMSLSLALATTGDDLCDNMVDWEWIVGNGLLLVNSSLLVEAVCELANVSQHCVASWWSDHGRLICVTAASLLAKAVPQNC